MKHCNNFIEFIKKTPTAFHAIKEIKVILDKKGFMELNEYDTWNLEANKKYYVTRNHSSIVAFKTPSNPSESHFQIVASHSDSPCFKIKPNGILVSGSYTKLNTEKYGGTILSTWLDKPLGIAGRIYTKEDNEIKENIIDLKNINLVIPNVAIHMNREINTTFAYNPQVDLLPLLSTSLDKDVTIQKYVAKALDIDANKLISHDLFIYNKDRGMLWGENNEFISAPQIDNLECAYTSLIAFINSNVNDDIIPTYACFDNEEVGSSTKQGANSTFLEDVLKRVHFAFSNESDGYFAKVAKSFLVSADNAHALHPNHPEKSDATNQVLMNKGIVIKSHASQSYTSDALSIAIFTSILDKANVPYQFFANRSDMASGGTLGNISSSHVSVPSLDIGLAQLAMHSSYETAGSNDIDHMINGLKAFFETNIKREKNNYSI